MYTEEYGGYFMEGFAGTSKGTGNNRWCKAMGAYHKYDSEVACCPNATRPWFDEFANATGLEGTFRGSTSAWGYWHRDGWLKPLKGSYGISGRHPSIQSGADGTGNPFSEPPAPFAIPIAVQS
jgi:hypothetical protein